MSQKIPAGIDFGNTRSMISAFVINQSDYAKSSVEIIPDRNGVKEPSSQIFYGEQGRSSATAAYLLSNRNPSNCIQFVKSSIKRKYTATDEKLKKIVKAIRDEKDSIVYHIDGYNPPIKPSQLAGDYICDRIQDIATRFKGADGNIQEVLKNIHVTIAVPEYLINGHEVDIGFASGLTSSLESVSSVKYSLISEMDAIALEYGYYMNLRKEFTAAPLVVLFVGVSFYEAHAFVVKYTQDCFEILHKETTDKVSSFMLDTFIIDLTIDEFNNTSDCSEDGEFDPDYGLFYNFAMFKKAKEQLSNEDYTSVELELRKYDRQNHEFAVEIQADDFNQKIEESGMLNELETIVKNCMKACTEQGLTINALEISSDGIRTQCFRKRVQEVTKISFWYELFGVLPSPHLELNTYRSANSVITKGCSEYSFYTMYKDNPAFSSVVSLLCESVHPLEVQKGSDQEAESMRRSREQEKLKGEAAKAYGNALNQFHTEVKGIRDKIEDRTLFSYDNYYFMNRDELMTLIDQFKKKANTIKETNPMIALIEEFRETIQKVMDVFIVKYEEERAQKRKEEEEEERRRQEEERRQREEAERLRIEEETRTIQTLRSEYINTFLMNKHVPAQVRDAIQSNYKIIDDERFQFDTLPQFCQSHIGVLISGDKEHASTSLPLHRRNRSHPLEREGIRHMFLVHDQRIQEKIVPTRPIYLPLAQSATPLGSMQEGQGNIEIVCSKQLLALDNGLWYVGPIKKGLPDGPDGRLYRQILHGTERQVELVSEGEFVKGKLHGHGKMFKNNTLYCEGTFKEGELVAGTRINANQSLANGEFVNGKLKGGKLLLRNGIWIQGEWENGKLTGPVNYQFFNIKGTCDSQSGCLQIWEDCIVFNEQGRSFIFYFSGDIFVGLVEGRKEVAGDSFIYFPSARSSFIHFQIGNFSSCNIISTQDPFTPFEFINQK